MNNLQFTISIQHNSDRIISSSEEKFAGIRNYSLIKIGDDPTLYTILSKDNFFYIKPFESQDAKTIIIDEMNPVLQLGDSIKLTHKEFEFITLFDILDGGKNYKVNDEIIVNGGVLSIDISTGTGVPTSFIVTDIDEYTGAVRSLKIKDKGLYTIAPNEKSNTVRVNSESQIDNMIIGVRYSEASNRTIIEREIESITVKDNKTYIILNYSLPQNIKTGKLSVEKAYLILNSPYKGPTKSNVTYNIYRDFTPNLRLGLVLKNSLSSELILNRNSHTIDQEIQSLKDRVKQLESKSN